MVNNNSGFLKYAVLNIFMFINIAYLYPQNKVGFVKFSKPEVTIIDTIGKSLKFKQLIYGIPYYKEYSFDEREFINRYSFRDDLSKASVKDKINGVNYQTIFNKSLRIDYAFQKIEQNVSYEMGRGKILNKEVKEILGFKCFQIKNPYLGYQNSLITYNSLESNESGVYTLQDDTLYNSLPLYFKYIFDGFTVEVKAIEYVKEKKVKLPERKELDFYLRFKVGVGKYENIQKYETIFEILNEKIQKGELTSDQIKLLNIISAEEVEIDSDIFLNLLQNNIIITNKDIIQLINSGNVLFMKNTDNNIYLPINYEKYSNVIIKYNLLKGDYLNVFISLTKPKYVTKYKEIALWLAKHEQNPDLLNKEFLNSNFKNNYKDFLYKKTFDYFNPSYTDIEYGPENSEISKCNTTFPFSWFNNFKMVRDDVNNRYGLFTKGDSCILPVVFMSISGADYDYWINSYGMAKYNIKNNSWNYLCKEVVFNRNRKQKYIHTYNDEYILLNGEVIIDTFRDFRIYDLSQNGSDFIITKNKRDENIGLFDLKRKKFVLSNDFDKIDATINPNIFCARKENKYYLINIINRNIRIDTFVYLQYKNSFSHCFVIDREYNRKLVSLTDSKLNLIQTDSIILKDYANIPLERKNDSGYIVRKFFKLRKGTFEICEDSLGKYGLIGLNKNIIFDFNYEFIEHLDGEYLVFKTKGKYFLYSYDYNDHWVPVLSDCDMIYGTKNVIYYTTNGLYGIVTKRFYHKIPLSKDVRVFSFKNSHYIVACKNLKDEWFLYNNGKPCHKLPFADIMHFNLEMHNEGSLYLKVKVKNKWGVVNQYGEIVVEPRFDEILDEYQNLIVVRKGKKFGIVDIMKNDFSYPLIYDAIIRYKDNYYFAVRNQQRFTLFPLLY